MHARDRIGPGRRRRASLTRGQAGPGWQGPVGTVWPHHGPSSLTRVGPARAGPQTPASPFDTGRIRLNGLARRTWPARAETPDAAAGPSSRAVRRRAHIAASSVNLGQRIRVIVSLSVSPYPNPFTDDLFRASISEPVNPSHRVRIRVSSSESPPAAVDAGRDGGYAGAPPGASARPSQFIRVVLSESMYPSQFIRVVLSESMYPT